MDHRPNEALYAAHHQVGPLWVTPMSAHSHTYVEMLVVLNGALDVDLADRRVRVNAGDVVCYLPGQSHGESCPPNGRCDFVVLAFPQPLPGTVPLVTHDRSGRLCALARWMHEEEASSYVRSKTGMSTLLGSFLYEFVKTQEFQPEDPLTRVRSFLRDRLAEKHALDDLARMAGLSKFHFVRQYKRATGCTPMEDLLKMRIDKAASWLLTTMMPIKTIALQAGFCDVSYFSRAFRLVKGATPAAFRAGGGRETPAGDTADSPRRRLSQDA